MYAEPHITKRAIAIALVAAAAAVALPTASRAGRDSSLAPVRWRYRPLGPSRLSGLSEQAGAYSLQPSRRTFSQYTPEEQAWVLEAIRQIARLDAEALILQADALRSARDETSARNDQERLAQMRKRAAARRPLDRNRRQRQACLGILWLRVPDAVARNRGMWSVAARPNWAMPSFRRFAYMYRGLVVTRRYTPRAGGRATPPAVRPHRCVPRGCRSRVQHVRSGTLTA